MARVTDIGCGLRKIPAGFHAALSDGTADGDRIALDVGLYSMANAAGRLPGTVLSGLGYQAGGLPLCLAAATAMVLLARTGAGRWAAETQA